MATIRILPLYAALYGFSQLAVQRKFDYDNTLETIASTLRSSAFIFFHAYNGSLMACFLRYSFGRFYYRVLICIPTLISCYLALMIEKPNRRQALAFYMLNLASEVVYRMLVTKGYFIPIRNGETLLFAASLASWFHMIKKHGFGHDPVSSVVKLIVGRDEATSRSSRNKKFEYQKLNEQQDKKLCLNDTQDKQSANDSQHQIQTNKLKSLYELIFKSKHHSCPHAEATCAEYVTCKIASRFALGYGIQVCLKLISKPAQLIMDPRKVIVDSLTDKSTLRNGMFLGTLVASGRLTYCLLRRYSNSNSIGWHAPVSGFVSGLSMLWAPRSSLSMYIMWKAVEQYYLQAARAGKVKHFDFTIMTIYSISAATILYTFALEPRFIRPSYMKFLDALSNHRLHQLNRLVLDVFGTGASVGYEDYFPNLDPKYMSNEFQELVFNWMIQPY